MIVRTCYSLYVGHSCECLPYKIIEFLDTTHPKVVAPAGNTLSFELLTKCNPRFVSSLSF